MERSRLSVLLKTALPLMLICSTWVGSAKAKTPVILSTDVGNEIDDQWAIFHILVSPQFNVLGIISAHAPSLSPPAGRTSYMILLDVVENRLQMKTHPPLFEGASLPLGDLKTPRPNAAVDFIIESSKGFSRDDRLTVMVIGVATDVASAILEDPTIAGRIHVLGGAFPKWPEGGLGFNVSNDIKAWQVILQSDVPVTLGSGEVQRATLFMNLDQARDLVSQHGPVGRWLWEDFQAWYWRHVKPWREDDFSKMWYIWDEIYLAYLLGMTKQQVYPRPTLRDDGTFEHPQTDKTITWISDLDRERLWTDFLKNLDAYQRTHAVGIAATRALLPN